MAKKKTKEVKKVVEKEVQAGPTFVREGPLSGEYHFAEINGAVVAESLEAAVEKAKELMVKNPGVLKS